VIIRVDGRGMLLNFIGIIRSKRYYYAAISTVHPPVLMFFIIRASAGTKKVMGRFTSPAWVNIWDGS